MMPFNKVLADARLSLSDTLPYLHNPFTNIDTVSRNALCIVIDSLNIGVYI